MTVVVTLEDFRPSPRYDSEPWTDARIYEATTAAGPWTLLETIAITPVDADPENPAYRSFTTDLGTADELWYQIVFIDADVSTGQPTVPVQNVPDDLPTYGTVSELARILKISSPTAAQETAMRRVLAASAGEINNDIDFVDVTTLLEWQCALATQVNLERAAELWKLQEVQFGIVGIGSEFGATHISRDTFLKHSITLWPLKQQFGFA